MLNVPFDCFQFELTVVIHSNLYLASACLIRLHDCILLVSGANLCKLYENLLYLLLLLFISNGDCYCCYAAVVGVVCSKLSNVPQNISILPSARKLFGLSPTPNPSPTGNSSQA